MPASWRRPAPVRPPRRGPFALGLAASVTLAVGVAWQLREPPPVPAQARMAAEAAEDALAPAAPAPASALPESTTGADGAGPAGETRAADGRRPATGASAQAAGDAAARAQAHQAAVAAAARRAAERGEKAERQLEPAAAQAAQPAPPPPAADLGAFAEPPARELKRDASTGEDGDAARAREHEAAVAAAAQRSAQRGDKAARQAAPAAFPATAPPAPPAPVFAPAPSSAAAEPPRGVPLVDEPRPAGEPDEIRVSGSRIGELDSDGLARLEADARLPADLWLRSIQGHRDRGDLDLARASLVRFTLVHPDVAVPADLRPLLP